MPQLHVAEKPSLATTIAKAIGVKKRTKHSILCANGDEVTWLFGHLVGLKEPHEYDGHESLKKWNKGELPIVRTEFHKKPTGDKSAKLQLKEVVKLLKDKKFDTIVNVGDAGREGQLLVDEVIEYAGGAKGRQVKRFWTSSLSDESVKNELANLRDNTDDKFVWLGLAGQARERADWLIGLNLTRAATIRAREHGIDNLVSVGRVQSVVLGLIVTRDAEIDNFISKDYLIPAIICGGGAIDATWQPSDTDSASFDSEGRLIDKDYGNRLIDISTATVFSANKTRKKVSAPLPYNLSSIQKIASSKYGFTGKQTLKICQSLYESKYTTYPRSDSRYLPEDQRADAGKKLKMLSSKFPAAGKADASLKHSAWNTKKVEESDHHAIMPDATVPKAGLSPDEEKIYKIVCESYIQLFMPDQETESHVIVLATNNEGGQKWKATSKTTIVEGWHALSGSTDGGKTLPAVNKGDVIAVEKGELRSKKTTPPARFNDGTLIEAMANIHKFVKDPDVRAQLKENQGIATEATRADAIELQIRRDYVARKGKTLISTPLGKEIDAALPEAVKDPGMTALWESYLKAIEKGQAPVDGFYKQIAETVKGMTEFILESEFAGRKIQPCPTCGRPIVRAESKKSKGKFYWRCVESSDCPLIGDKEGEPGEPFSKK